MKQLFYAGCVALVLVGCGKSPAPVTDSFEAAEGSNQQASSGEVFPEQDEPLISAGGDGLTGELPAQPQSDSQNTFDRLCEAYVNGDGDAWSSAEQELLELGPSIEPTLVAALSTGAVHEREHAAMMLAQIDVRSEDTKAALKMALQDESPLVRSNSASTLCAMGDRSNELLMAVQSLLKDDASEGRMTAAMLAGNLGESAKRLVPAVGELLEDEEESVREAAVKALGMLGPLSASQVEKLRSVAIADTSSTVRDSAEQALDQINESSLQPGSSGVIPVGGETDTPQ